MRNIINKLIARFSIIGIILITVSSTVSANITRLDTLNNPIDELLRATSKSFVKDFGQTIAKGSIWKFNYKRNERPTNDPVIWSIGDINADGFDELFVYIAGRSISGIYTDSYYYIFHGSPEGVNEVPDWEISIGDFPWLNSFSNIGDINNDGYNDIALTSGWAGRASIYLGSANGLSANSIKFDFQDEIERGSVYAQRVGDINGDGIDDVLFISEFYDEMAVLLGDNNFGPKSPEWMRKSSMDYIEEINGSFVTGDFNGDGYSDILISTYHISVFYGGPGIFSASPDIKLLTNEVMIQLGIDMHTYYPDNFNTSVIYGDYDGDGLKEIMVTTEVMDDSNSEIRELIQITYLYKNSGDGIDFQHPAILTYRSERMEYLNWKRDFPGNMGDINQDGNDDLTLGGTIYFGSKNFTFDSKLVSPYDALTPSGDFNGDGRPDFIGYLPRYNLYYDIFFTPEGSRPMLACTQVIEDCFKGSEVSYSIPGPLINGEIKTINFLARDTENFRRQGYYNASGEFPPSSSIIWTAIGYNNQSVSCTTQVQINHVPITNVSIKPNSAHPKGDPNTFYTGYGATEFRIEALPAGGGGPYTYLWSNGSTEKNPRISETVPGTYPYWVKMKNVHGCESSDTVIIKVENALCSSPLVDVVMSQYPMILQNPILANLIKSNSKIAVCKDGQTMCFTKAVVDIRITRAGYTIGACTPGVIPAEAFMTDEIENILRGELKVIVAPNPSSHSFQLSVVSIYNAPVMIRIMDLAGRQVEVLNNVSANQTITVGHKLRAGTYIAEVILGKERKVVKLVKMN